MSHPWTSHFIWQSNVAKKPAAKVDKNSISAYRSINARARLGDTEFARGRGFLFIYAYLWMTVVSENEHISPLYLTLMNVHDTLLSKKPSAVVAYFHQKLHCVKLVTKQRVSKNERAPARASIHGMFRAENKEKRNAPVFSSTRLTLSLTPGSSKETHIGVYGFGASSLRS